MPTTWRSWTTREIALVEKLRGEGKTCKEIANITGRSVGGVARKCLEREIPKTNTLALAWLEQYRLDPSPTVAAKVMGVSVHAAKKWKTRLRKAGFNVKGQY